VSPQGFLTGISRHSIPTSVAASHLGVVVDPNSLPHPCAQAADQGILPVPGNGAAATLSSKPSLTALRYWHQVCCNRSTGLTESGRPSFLREVETVEQVVGLRVALLQRPQAKARFDQSQDRGGIGNARVDVAPPRPRADQQCRYAGAAAIGVGTELTLANGCCSPSPQALSPAKHAIRRHAADSWVKLSERLKDLLKTAGVR